MGLTSDIEQFLLDMMEDQQSDYIEIGRNDLAEKFQCAPSQINYVLTTRFTPYKGYYVESRRGGGGYVKIVKLEMSEHQLINGVLNNTIKNKITYDKAKHIIDSLQAEGILTRKEKLLVCHAIDDNALKDIDQADRNFVRASVLKNILLALMRE